jgi:hypothetical protein|tara:strand:+ start:228 stop:428 length:201 start_codon:yes stop_codon:yes gene_type:complete
MFRNAVLPGDNQEQVLVNGAFLNSKMEAKARKHGVRSQGHFGRKTGNSPQQTRLDTISLIAAIIAP